MADVFNKNPSSFVDMNELFPVLNERTGLTSEQFKKVVENLIYVYNNLASGGSGGGSSGGVVFTPSVDVNGNLSWTNNGGLTNPETVNIRGATGATGAAAGFGTPTASVDGNTGTPSVTVTASGEDTAKVFNFEFKNLKGDKGDTGATGSTGAAGATGATPNISVTATQLPADAQPTATRSGTDENPIITFGIPQASGGGGTQLYKHSKILSHSGIDYYFIVINDISTPMETDEFSKYCSVQFKKQAVIRTGTDFKTIYNILLFIDGTFMYSTSESTTPNTIDMGSVSTDSVTPL